MKYSFLKILTEPKHLNGGIGKQILVHPHQHVSDYSHLSQLNKHLHSALFTQNIIFVVLAHTHTQQNC